MGLKSVCEDGETGTREMTGRPPAKVSGYDAQDMNISCVIVSYNNGMQLKDAIMSVLEQTRPVDEIIIADDGSTDGSRQLVESLSHRYPNIKAVLRARNLGVSANRDLAMRQARGEFITWLDGDDYFLPTKIESEVKTLGERSGVIAYSDVKWADRGSDQVRTGANADFSKLGASDRMRWLLRRNRQSPAALLLPKDLHLRIGGYNHNLRTYEDWDYMLRLATQPLCWAHSGTAGLVAHPAGGLSRRSPLEHMRDELRVLRLNQGIVRQYVGFPLLLETAGRVVAFRSKWWLIRRYRDTRDVLARLPRRSRGSAR